MTITLLDLNKCHMQEAAHFTGQGFFGYIYRCQEHPRLQRMDKYLKKDRSVQSEWIVDGERRDSLDAAIAALNLPAVLTDDEQVALAKVPLEPVGLRKMEDILAGCDRPEGAVRSGTPHSLAHRMIDALQNKGAVEIGRSPDRDDGKPWHESVPEHNRYSPTIRRLP